MAESIGSTLKQRREARHLSIGQVAEQTRIRSFYLQALENDDLSAIPSMVQARGFLRIYAEFLGLNLDELSFSPRSVEAQTPVSPAAPLAEPIPAPAAPDNPSSDSQGHPGFFSGLRDRLRRHPSAESATSKAESVAPPRPEPEPEVFVPARIHEELPAAPQESSIPESTEELKAPARPVRAQRSSGRKTAAKKPVRARARKSSVKTTRPSEGDEGEKALVKKKIAQ